MTYYMVDEDDEPVPQYGWRAPYYQAGASNIEATAYALLTYTHKGDIVKAMEVAKWIVKQRNPNGGFSSTQVSLLPYLEKISSGCVTSLNPSFDSEYLYFS